MTYLSGQKQVFTFSRQLFLSVIALFLTFVLCFMAFQYRREKDYKVEVLNLQLQHYNNDMKDYLSQQDTLYTHLVNEYVQTHKLEQLRVTLINPEGDVLFDNTKETTSSFKNHLDRKEVKQALKEGSGYAISRLSESVGKEFFYSAQYYPDLQLIIRSALPYTVDLVDSLQADSHYIWFAGIVSLVLIGIFYSFTHKLGMSITQLKDFAMKADQNMPIDTWNSFPKNELGEISQHIIQIYHRLHRTKEALYIEREKLITHLQISHEVAIMNSASFMAGFSS